MAEKVEEMLFFHSRFLVCTILSRSLFFILSGLVRVSRFQLVYFTYFRIILLRLFRRNLYTEKKNTKIFLYIFYLSRAKRTRKEVFGFRFMCGNLSLSNLTISNWSRKCFLVCFYLCIMFLGKMRISLGISSRILRIAVLLRSWSLLEMVFWGVEA